MFLVHCETSLGCCPRDRYEILDKPWDRKTIGTQDNRALVNEADGVVEKVP